MWQPHEMHHLAHVEEPVLGAVDGSDYALLHQGAETVFKPQARSLTFNSMV